MTEALERRVTEVETLVWEIPNLLNVRFARFETEIASLRGAIVDNTGRLAAMERAMTMVQTDMRDLRGGVTRQLVAQDARIGEIAQQVADVKTEIGGVRAEIGGMRAEIGGMKADIGGMKAEIGGMKAEIGGMKAEIGGLQAKIDEVLRRLPA
jgi:archaellum component FlaC